MAVRNSARLKEPVRQRRINVEPLWAHQKESLKLYRKTDRVLDTSDPGTGKTRAHLEAFAKRRRKGSRAALVIAPKTLLESAWGDDIRKFTPDMMYSLAYAENREAAFSIDMDIYITNTDATKWLAKQPAKFFRRFDTLIIDELSNFKHRTSLRSRALNKIKKYFKYRSGLTGTPNSNTITDIWHQAFLLDDGKRLGTSFFHFRNSTCQPEQIGPRPEHVRWVDKPGAEQAVAALLTDISIRHEFEECMDIPPNHTQVVKYRLPSKLMRQYREMEALAILELENDSVTAIHAGVLRNKLLQISSGAVYADHQPQVLDTGRYELVMDLVEQRKHSVVFFVWTHQRQQLEKEAEKRGISYATIDGTVPKHKRTEIVQAYQEGAYQTLFLQPKTGAHGLTLTKGTRTIWASPIYEPDFLKQGKHRIYRGGQKRRTETILVEAEGTVEQIVYDRLNQKNQRMMDLLTLLKEARS